MPDDTPHPENDAPRLLCPACGYNVGPTSDFEPGKRSTCPECGEGYVADLLSRMPKPQPITGGRVVWHLFWPAIIVFFASIVPVLSLLMMPIAVLTLLITNGFTSAGIAKRVVYHNVVSARASKGEKQAGIAIALWLAQAGLIAFAAFGGCNIALNNLNFH